MIAQKLIDWLRSSWKEKYGDLVSISDISKIGPKSARGKAVELVDFLVLYGHLKEEQGPVEIRGKKRRKVFLILDDEDQDQVSPPPNSNGVRYRPQNPFYPLD